jgi:protein-S-isoprenylcysteine O-methyltransferase Ste14
MTQEAMLQVVAATGILQAGATLFFPIFWLGFGFWRRHRALTYLMIVATLIALAVAIYGLRAEVYAVRVELPRVVRVAGWLVIAAAFVLGMVADRQIGMHVRSFGPLFDPDGRIALVTTGAYGVVRHPIYSAGIGWQIGLFLATGYVAVAVACAIFAAGALWFTRQEERRLTALLADPTEYDRYRERVPALIPGLGRRRHLRAGR